MKHQITLISFFLAATAAVVVGCANEGALRSVPRFAQLVMTVAPKALTGGTSTVAATLGDSMDAHALVAEGSDIPVEVYDFFKNCEYGSNDVSKCKDATPVTNPDLCQNIGGSYLLQGMSALEYSCYTDSLMAYSKTAINDCKYATGKELDVSKYVPWIKSWGAPSEKLNFQGAESSGDKTKEGEAFKYVQVKPTGALSGQYVLAIENKIGVTLGYKEGNGQFVFIYIKAKDAGTSNAGLHAILGNIQTGKLEGYRSHTGVGYTTRIKSDGKHVFYQKWNSPNPSGTPGDYGCFDLTTKKAVASSNCETAFNIAAGTLGTGDHDATFDMKLVNLNTIVSLQATGAYDMEKNAPDPEVSGCL